MNASSHQIDPDALKQFQFRLFTKLEGAMTSGMVHLGDRLGLYRAMVRSAPLTSSELAARTGLVERWVREWAYNQAAAGMIEVDDDERFSLTPEAQAVLASPDHEAYGLGLFYQLPRRCRRWTPPPTSFRTGIGHDFDSSGPEGAIGVERGFEPWNRAHLLTDVLPLLDGVVGRLRAGCAVADVGCGAGGAVLLMAEAFPASHFVGYDISRHALDRAEQRRREADVANARFVDPRDEQLPDDRSLGLVTTFDCLHDMTDPAGTARTIFDALAPDGTWLLVDIKALDTFAENVGRNPMAALMYGVSVLSCLSWSLSVDGGAGLGTLGLPESVARRSPATPGSPASGGSPSTTRRTRSTRSGPSAHRVLCQEDRPLASCFLTQTPGGSTRTGGHLSRVPWAR